MKCKRAGGDGFSNGPQGIPQHRITIYNANSLGHLFGHNL